MRFVMAYLKPGVLLAVLVVLLFRSPALMSAALGNLEMLALRGELLDSPKVIHSIYPLYQVLDESPVTARVVQTLRQAVDLDRGNSSAQWRLARAALAIGDSVTAADVLKPIQDGAKQNLLLHEDMLTAFSYSGRSDEVIHLYESYPLWRHTRWISDTVALAYLQQSLAASGANHKDALAKALALRPWDIYINYALWRAASDVGQHAEAESYSETLKHTAAIQATDDDRILSFSVEVIPDLVRLGLWSREKTWDVLSYLAWQHSSVKGIEHSLEQLAERYPATPDWFFYLAELDYRRGRVQQAERLYQQVVALDSSYSRAYLRLGMICEARSQSPGYRQEMLTRAAEWYERYRQAFPGDAIALWRLVRVCSWLEQTGDRSVCDPAVQAEWLKQAATATPAYPVGQTREGGWTLLGYDVDQEGMVRGEPVDLLLYWKGPASAPPGSQQEGWQRAGERWVQILPGIHNLISNGGFELGLEGGAPVGFPTNIEGESPNSAYLVADVRDGKDTTALLLYNPKGDIRASLVSASVPAKANQLYLQGGWIKSINARGYSGRCFAYVDWQTRPCDTYIQENIVNSPWRYDSGITWSVVDTDRIQIWLYNYKTAGYVYFDNVILVEIGSPHS